MIGRLPIAKMLAATVALTAVISVVMLQISWDGQQASTAAPKIDQLLDVMIVLSSFVFSLVMVMLFYALWKFRAKPGDESDGEPIHGNTRLEIAWTVIPTIIVLFGAAYSWIVLDEIEAKAAGLDAGRRLRPAVRLELRLPGQGQRLDRRASCTSRSTARSSSKCTRMDVIHSFWVPEWRIKKDNVPGITTTAIGHPGQGRHLPADLHRALRLRPRDDAGESRGRDAGRLPQMGRRPQDEDPALAAQSRSTQDAEVETRSPSGRAGHNGGAY